MSKTTDWEGQPIPEGEKPSDIVLAWEISPHPTNREYDLYVERSWQGMLDYLTCSGIEELLERFVCDHTKEELLAEELVIRIRVRKWAIEDLP